MFIDFIKLKDFEDFIDAIGRRNIGAIDGKFHPSSLMCSVPGLKIVSPRDGETVENTADVIFIAALLERSYRTGWSRVMENSTNLYQDEVADKPASVHSQSVRYISSHVLRVILKGHPYWYLRNLLAEPDAHEIRLPQTRPKHPVALGDDHLMRSFREQRFLSWFDLDSVRSLFIRKSGYAWCPLCGSVCAESATICSPKNKLAELRQTKITLWVCPYCLGVLDERVLKTPRMVNRHAVEF